MGGHTHIFKTVAGCAVRADVYPARGADGPAPAVIWLHGGALVWGSRESMTRPDQVELYTRAGYTFIAMDYRLAPETRLPEILQDVLDGLAWVRARGRAELGVCPDRLALVGHSAGGYLALLAGARSAEPVRAIVSMYGYGNLAADWYALPHPHSLARPRVTEADARAAVGLHPLSAAGRERSLFYLWGRQNGWGPQELLGLPHDAPREALHPWCPELHVHPRFPPTLLVHGEQDRDVPYTQSEAMAAALSRAGVSNRLILLPGYGHVFDDRVDDPPVVKSFVEILGFLSHHLTC